jgi:F-type H+-transporting ATPase subunit a
VIRRFCGLGLALLLLAAGRSAAAQQPEATHGAGGSHPAASNEIDIMGHIGNSHEIDVPYWKSPYFYPVELPQWAPVKVGPLSIDFSPTKHLVFLLLSATLVALVFLLSARAIAGAQAQGKPAKGFAGVMEAMALFIRQEVVLPNVGPHGEGYAPYLLTTFFLILVCNLLGLLPWGASATGNIEVTAGLALLAFLVIEISGMRTLGWKGYLGTIFFLPKGLPTIMKPIILVVMTPIELIGKLAKPFALAVRLFANMTAGHALVLALIGLIFTFQSYAVGAAAAPMATAIMLLELFVAFLQAFVFTLLTSVFIGLMRAEHH